jgi:epimerase transport system membrane fusion protein
MTQALAKLELLKEEFSKTAEGAPSDAAPASVDAPAAPAPAPEAKTPKTTAAAASAGPEFGDATRLVRGGLLIIAGFFGFLGGWAAFSPIDSAAISYGVVGAEGSRKAVQHIDGGVVSAIDVREGDLVQAGQELIRVDELQAKAALEIYSASVVTLSAVLARLEAEAKGADTIDFPKDLLKRRDEPAIGELLSSQEQLFDARRSANVTQVATIREQIKQAKSQIDIHRGQADVAANQYKMVNEELGPKQMLYDKGYATNSPVLQLKRMASALLGQQQEYLGNIARLEHTIGQLESQIGQITSDYKLRVAQELEDTRTKMTDARERERVAKDVLERTVIRAPVAGHVLGLRVNTIGGVIGKGELLLEIVPAAGAVSIKARLRPTDALDVHEGMHAEIRVLTAQGRTLPVLHGVVTNRSADARSDADGQQLYFEVSIGINAAELKPLGDFKLSPGTPVEVIIPTGSRTVLDYILEPMEQSMRHGLREK